MNTDNTEHAVCPYCGHVDFDCGEHLLTDGERVLTDCHKCQKPHYVEGHVIATYTTHKIVGQE